MSSTIFKKSGSHRWLTALMVAAILGITAFQLYWLQQSYRREKNALHLKTNASFQETVLQLWASKLNLDSLGGMHWDSNKKSMDTTVNVFVSAPHDTMRIKVRPRREMVSTINIIQQKLKDSLIKTQKGEMVIALNETTISSRGEKSSFNKLIPGPAQRGNHIIRLLSGVDSLQDSLRLSEIDSAYTRRLQHDKLLVSYSISRIDSCDSYFVPNPNQVIVGFIKPSVYTLTLNKNLPYLLKQIAVPILFSVLLLGITILSFVLLFRNMQRQRRLAEQKNEFISNITHELKTPIATVGVAIEALKNFNAIDNPERTREYLNISQNELQRLSLLVDKVLKLSMFENKELQLKVEAVNMEQLVGEVAESLKLQFDKKAALITINSHGDTTLQGDRLHLLSVVFNLLDNALKYGKEKLQVNVLVSGDVESVTLTVSDNGIGIPHEYREKIFEKFFRVPHGDTHNAKGYGLGLSYVAQVVKKHNGTIMLKSEPGNGTAFTITLPKNKL